LHSCRRRRWSGIAEQVASHSLRLAISAACDACYASIMLLTRRGLACSTWGIACPRGLIRHRSLSVVKSSNQRNQRAMSQKKKTFTVLLDSSTNSMLLQFEIELNRIAMLLQIAVEGCCHGELEKIYATLQHLERAEGRKVDLLICCGDFQVINSQEIAPCLGC